MIKVKIHNDWSNWYYFEDLVDDESELTNINWEKFRDGTILMLNDLKEVYELFKEAGEIEWIETKHSVFEFIDTSIDLYDQEGEIIFILNINRRGEDY